MSDDVDYREFEQSLTDVLTESHFSHPRLARLWKARGAVNKVDPR